MKKLPDDIIIVILGIFCAILFMWTSLNSVRSTLDMNILLLFVFHMIVIPMLYSIFCSYKRKKQLVIKLLNIFFYTKYFLFLCIACIIYYIPFSRGYW